MGNLVNKAGVGAESFVFGLGVAEMSFAGDAIRASEDYSANVSELEGNINTFTSASNIASSGAETVLQDQITLQREKLSTLHAEAPDNHGMGFEVSLLMGCFAVGYAASRAINGSVKFIYSKVKKEPKEFDLGKQLK